MERKRSAAAGRMLGAAIAACALLLAAAGCSAREDAGRPSDAGLPPSTGQPLPAGDYYADIAIEDYGTITISLDPEAAPVTAGNFVALAESGFYDGLTFHRIIDGFMMQGGDPTGTGYGGSGTSIAGEFSENGYDNPLSHTRGTVSMARSEGYDSASSQFFIVQEDSTYLDGAYAAFGRVVSGMDIVDRICADAEDIDGNGLIAADAQPVIESIAIRTE